MKWSKVHIPRGEYLAGWLVFLGACSWFSHFSAGSLRTAENSQFDHGAVIRGNMAEKKIALVFTGHEFADGGEIIRSVLEKTKTPAGFFFTGDFYRRPAFTPLIRSLIQDGHYLGPHSDKHLLYCAWERRDELLVSKAEFTDDIFNNYRAMAVFGISKDAAPYFIPPYEWYNEAVVAWAKRLGLTLFNFTPGTRSNADYTTPDMPNYRSSAVIYQSILDYERTDPRGLNGFILLVHIGTHPDRKDKFNSRLEELISELKSKGYVFIRIDELLADLHRRPPGDDKQPDFYYFR
jgi:peptidoglycan/xylan/chitin deacetylase (PgdA/CDA1 family)